MALSSDDHKWLQDRFDDVKGECRSVIQLHETIHHPPGRTFRTIATLFGIGAAGATICGGLFAAFLWVLRNMPR